MFRSETDAEKKRRRGVDVDALAQRNRRAKSPAFKAKDHGVPADGLISAATALRLSLSEGR